AYTYLPLGLRALRKAEQIVREEMDRAGAVELLMPALTPISLWEQTGRVEAFGDVLIQLSVRRQNRKVQMALGPTHEEVITDLVSRHVSSYRQMPVILYQIQTKFRNEERPRFGVLRTSEFLMKDAYSFNASVESLDASYDKMYDAYCKIFDRCGIEYLPVEAESGPIGGDASHEFMIPAENGEDCVAYCPTCGYAANLERADVGEHGYRMPDVPMEEPQDVATPDAGTIAQVCEMLGTKPQQMIKTLVYSADGKPVVVLLRGDREANEGKIRRAVAAERLELAEPDVIQKVTGAPVGFAGPIGLAADVPIWADRDLLEVRNAITGANKADTHTKGVNLDRDCNIDKDRYADLRNVDAGDPCPRCGQKMELRNAIEVGHVFKLGTKYSEALSARFLDDKERLNPIIMGCYGIGINRIVAGLIENNHDKFGIIWPVALAPHEVLLVPMKVDDEATMQLTDTLYDELKAAGVDVMIDDRNARAGVKFKDADLIGIPLRIVLGPRGLKDGKLEIKWRWDSEAEMIDIEGAAPAIAKMIGKERKSSARFKARASE
ncbi:MAG: proline--tRNA ligase, partial [Planctomycetota bacterium]|nr:proline--tRNA ligase [Planctomycetota bacterium]